MRLSREERELLELAAAGRLEGQLGSWPVLRGLLGRLGAPTRHNLGGTLLRLIAHEVLVALGLQPQAAARPLPIKKSAFLRARPRVARWEPA